MQRSSKLGYHGRLMKCQMSPDGNRIILTNTKCCVNTLDFNSRTRVSERVQMNVQTHKTEKNLQCRAKNEKRQQDKQY